MLESNFIVIKGDLDSGPGIDVLSSTSETQSYRWLKNLIRIELSFYSQLTAGCHQLAINISSSVVKFI